MLQLLWFLLPLLAVGGWWFGYRHKKNFESQTQTQDPEISSEYFLGLNYLLHDEADKAVEVFIKMLEVNTNTVETYLALGNLFRRRGGWLKELWKHLKSLETYIINPVIRPPI